MYCIQRRFKELQFNVDMDIDDLRLRIYRHCGSLPEYMELRLGDITLEDGKTQREYVINISYEDTHTIILLIKTIYILLQIQYKKL